MNPSKGTGLSASKFWGPLYMLTWYNRARSFSVVTEVWEEKLLTVSNTPTT